MSYDTGGWPMPPEQPATPKRRPVFAWVIVVLNVLMLVLVVASIAGATDCSELAGVEREGCDAGTAIGVLMLLGFWAAVDVILGVLYVVTRRRR